MHRSGEDLGQGARLYRAYFDPAAQQALADETLERAGAAGWISPVTPGGRPFSVRQVNFGPLGWVSDRAGYRYQPDHPATGAPWPAIPASLLSAWQALQPAAPPPEACLVNHYQGAAKMGLHVDADEDDRQTGLVTVSLGASARFRLGGPDKRDPTRALTLESGDVLVMAGASRNAAHGVDRILPPSGLFSADLGFDGRLSLTLRRVTGA
ncbi:MAG: alpha-ketoglutarate-dependent dioxygenase AlkB [Pseudomonadota bacterium]